MSATPLKLKTVPGHQVLASAGKKILRPGGRAATEQLFKWAEFKPEETVLELAASFGESAVRQHPHSRDRHGKTFRRSCRRRREKS